MNTGNEARKTPVQELLRGIPEDHVIQFETDDNGFKTWHNCPIGRIAHEAADALAARQAEIEALRTELEALRAKKADITEQLRIERGRADNLALALYGPNTQATHGEQGNE